MTPIYAEFAVNRLAHTLIAFPSLLYFRCRACRTSIMTSTASASGLRTRTHTHADVLHAPSASAKFNYHSSSSLRPHTRAHQFPLHTPQQQQRAAGGTKKHKKKQCMCARVACCNERIFRPASEQSKAHNPAAFSARSRGGRGKKIRARVREKRTRRSHREPRVSGARSNRHTRGQQTTRMHFP